MNHKLSIDLPEILNLCVIRVVDLSIYNPDITVKCPQLQVSIPGFKNSVYVDNVQPEFSLNLTACDLKIQKDNCGSIYNDLPDGVYVFRYSVSPNDTVYVEQQYLRAAKAFNKLRNLLCELDLLNCVSNPQRTKMEDDAKKIRLYLDAAQAKVAYCRQATDGVSLWKTAVKMLDKYNCKNCH